MFVIQSLPRCGTHLLRTALASHGEIDCFGEVFNPHSRIHRYPVQRPTIAEVIEHCQSQVRQTGFVAHAHVGLTEDETGPGLDRAYRQRSYVKAARGLWRTLPPDTLVITLRRNNLLERYVSWLVAHRRQDWLVYRGQAVPELVRVRVNCRQMLDDFERTETLMTIARNRFPHAVFATYEELVSEATPTFERIQSYLGVESRQLIPDTLKVGHPLRETIVNFDEVSSALRHTRYESFLDSLPAQVSD